MAYFRAYSSSPLSTGIINCIWETASGETFIDGKQANLRPFRILISLLDKPEIGMEVIEWVLIDLFRFFYLEYHKLNSESEGNGLVRNNSSSSLTKLSKRNGRTTLADNANQSTELIKTANLLFGSFEISFLWDYLAYVYGMSVPFHRYINSEEDKIPVRGHGGPSLDHMEFCTLLSFLLDKVALVSNKKHSLTL